MERKLYHILFKFYVNRLISIEHELLVENKTRFNVRFGRKIVQ